MTSLITIVAGAAMSALFVVGAICLNRRLGLGSVDSIVKSLKDGKLKEGEDD